MARRTFFITVLCAAQLVSCTHAPFKPLAATTNCPTATPTFENDIQPIFKATCAKVGCHDGDNMPHDFSLYTELLPVLTDSSLYYYVVLDKTMPQDTALTDNEFQLVRCWLEGGYPEK